MSLSMSAWGWSVRDRNEAVIIESLPWRDRWRLYVAVAVTSPRRLVGYFHDRFLRWAPALGDHWFDYLRDIEGVVVRCLPDGVVLEVASGNFIASHGAPWDVGYPPGAIPVYQEVVHGDRRCWTVAR